MRSYFWLRTECKVHRCRSYHLLLNRDAVSIPVCASPDRDMTYAFASSQILLFCRWQSICVACVCACSFNHFLSIKIRLVFVSCVWNALHFIVGIFFLELNSYGPNNTEEDFNETVLNFKKWFLNRSGNVCQKQKMKIKKTKSKSTPTEPTMRKTHHTSIWISFRFDLKRRRKPLAKWMKLFFISFNFNGKQLRACNACMRARNICIW